MTRLPWLCCLLRSHFSLGWLARASCRETTAGAIVASEEYSTVAAYSTTFCTVL